MTHILFVTPYYPPEIGAPQTRIGETALRLVRRGHRVTVLTTLPNYPTGVVPPEYRGGKRRRELREGVDVIRVWSYVRPNAGFLGRILAQLSFGCLAGPLGVRAVGHPDIVIVESPPLFDAIAGRALARWKRCPFIFTVADIWPAAAVEMGVLRNKAAIRLAEWLEQSTYRRAAAVWTMTPGFRNALVSRGLPPDKVFVVTNGVDLSLFRPLPKAQARAELGWDGRFTLLVAGTIGLAQGLDTLVAAADRLRGRHDIRIVLAGDGASRCELESIVARLGLTNVTFLGAQPHERMPWLQAAADVCFSSLRALPIFAGTVPVRLYEAMASARPVLLAAAPGQARQLVEEAGAAIAVAPTDPQAIAEAIIYLSAHAEQAELMGRRGRAFVESRFGRDQLADTLEGRIAAILGGGWPTVMAPATTPPASRGAVVLTKGRAVNANN